MLRWRQSLLVATVIAMLMAGESEVLTLNSPVRRGITNDFPIINEIINNYGDSRKCVLNYELIGRYIRDFLSFPCEGRGNIYTLETPTFVIKGDPAINKVSLFWDSPKTIVIIEDGKCTRRAYSEPSKFTASLLTDPECNAVKQNIAKLIKEDDELSSSEENDSPSYSFQGNGGSWKSNDNGKANGAIGETEIQTYNNLPSFHQRIFVNVNKCEMKVEIRGKYIQQRMTVLCDSKTMNGPTPYNSKTFSALGDPIQDDFSIYCNSPKTIFIFAGGKCTKREYSDKATYTEQSMSYSDCDAMKKKASEDVAEEVRKKKNNKTGQTGTKVGQMGMKTGMKMGQTFRPNFPSPSVTYPSGSYVQQPAAPQPASPYSYGSFKTQVPVQGPVVGGGITNDMPSINEIILDDGKLRYIIIGRYIRDAITFTRKNQVDITTLKTDTAIIIGDPAINKFSLFCVTPESIVIIEGGKCTRRKYSERSRYTASVLKYAACEIVKQNIAELLKENVVSSTPEKSDSSSSWFKGNGGSWKSNDNGKANGANGVTEIQTENNMISIGKSSNCMFNNCKVTIVIDGQYFKHTMTKQMGIMKDKGLIPINSDSFSALGDPNQDDFSIYCKSPKTIFIFEGKCTKIEYSDPATYTEQPMSDSDCNAMKQKASKDVAEEKRKLSEELRIQMGQLGNEMKQNFRPGFPFLSNYPSGFSQPAATKPAAPKPASPNPYFPFKTQRPVQGFGSYFSQPTAPYSYNPLKTQGLFQGSVVGSNSNINLPKIVQTLGKNSANICEVSITITGNNMRDRISFPCHNWMGTPITCDKSIVVGEPDTNDYFVYCNSPKTIFIYAKKMCTKREYSDRGTPTDHPMSDSECEAMKKRASEDVKEKKNKQQQTQPTLSPGVTFNSANRPSGSYVSQPAAPKPPAPYSYGSFKPQRPVQGSRVRPNPGLTSLYNGWGSRLYNLFNA